ncbi:hypothetical protein ATEIFO6365_0009044800 [Aspergillus terreus]|uniref:Uncharacterized protein n=1 Tax=Aspergillus terreus TaxID=33178 RepID=A0A5M3Z8D3_ASPTE|nr:hypothetical protein ATETN484_0011044300 [Aspergillus terreus]GFF19085.1 hypothetical protein ATEIFO6365_0009044800 [Aspergillus terreus]
MERRSGRLETQLPPSAIEDSQDLEPKMKRFVSSPEQPTQENPQQVHEARRKEGPPRENPRLSTARFWAQKAESLDGPAEFSSKKCSVSELLNPSEAFRREKPDKAETAATGPPALSNDAIADILRKTKPDCPHAQAWIQAHEIQKAEQQRKERAELRNKVARRVRDKARKAAKKSGASKREVNEFLGELPKEEQTNTAEQKPADPKDDTPEMILKRVDEAHERLKKTIEDCKRSRES